MGKKSKRNKKSSKVSTKPSIEAHIASPNNDADYTPGITTHVRRQQAPVEPGRAATIQGLVGRPDLNGSTGTIQKVLQNGRVAVEIISLGGTKFEKREVVAIQRKNLDVRWNITDRGGGRGVCPICMDTVMKTEVNNDQNASLFACCGAAVCAKCFVSIQSTKQRDVCPLCRADTSDCSDAAELARIRARANRGCANAMYNIGGYYDAGLYGVTQDQAVARVWYRKAAEKGENRAAHNLACSYRDGEGGPVDKPLAAKYFRVAAEGGHVEAATNLGIALGRGDGVERDPEEARKWLTKGANAGDELAVQQLQVLDRDGVTGNNRATYSMAGFNEFVAKMMSEGVGK